MFNRWASAKIVTYFQRAPPLPTDTPWWLAGQAAPHASNTGGQLHVVLLLSGPCVVSSMRRVLHASCSLFVVFSMRRVLHCVVLSGPCGLVFFSQEVAHVTSDMNCVLWIVWCVFTWRHGTLWWRKSWCDGWRLWEENWAYTPVWVVLWGSSCSTYSLACLLRIPVPPFRNTQSVCVDGGVIQGYEERRKW